MSRRTLTAALWARSAAGLGAEAQIRADSSPAIGPILAPDFYAERHKIDNFRDRTDCFRRITLRCGKAIACFMGVVFLVSARALQGARRDCGGRAGEAVAVLWPQG